MIRFLLRRGAFGLLALVTAASLAFLLAWNAPGGPAVGLAGEHGAPGYLEEVAARYGLDRPGLDIWLGWLGRLARGDLGHSWREQAPVAALILERAPVTLALMLPALLVAAVLGTGLGVLAAARPWRWPAAGFAALHAVPAYILAQGLVMVFALRLGWFPVQGWADARMPGGVLDHARHLVLPVLALALQQLAFVALLLRAGVAAEMRAPYAHAAQARGRTAWGVRWRHALPNAVLPAATLIAARFGGLIGGAIVVETAFALPGLGRLAVTAAIARDHPMVIGVVVVACACVMLANLLADILLAALDPRLRA